MRLPYQTCKIDRKVFPLNHPKGLVRNRLSSGDVGIKRRIRDGHVASAERLKLRERDPERTELGRQISDRTTVMMVCR
jgi:hypothetical protein